MKIRSCDNMSTLIRGEFGSCVYLPDYGGEWMFLEWRQSTDALDYEKVHWFLGEVIDDEICSRAV